MSADGDIKIGAKTSNGGLPLASRSLSLVFEV
jgi:hypothetical protein